MIIYINRTTLKCTSNVTDKLSDAMNGMANIYGEPRTKDETREKPTKMLV